jgi:hypothetical protein
LRHARKETAETPNLSNRPVGPNRLINQENSGVYANGGKFRQKRAIGGKTRREIDASTCRT